MFFRLCGPSWRIAMPSVSRTARCTALVTQMPPGWASAWIRAAMLTL
jgi:hypothetical protein